MPINWKSVSLKELGLRCWLPKRFVRGGRCAWVYRCTYPEKKNCQAVDAEVLHLLIELERTVARTSEKIDQLTRGRE